MPEVAVDEPPKEQTRRPKGWVVNTARVCKVRFSDRQQQKKRDDASNRRDQRVYKQTEPLADSRFGIWRHWRVPTSSFLLGVWSD